MLPPPRVPSPSQTSTATLPPPTSSSNFMTPKQLSDFDDACTAAIVDPTLGFVTHKMSLRYRGPKQKDQRSFKAIVGRFQNHQDYEKTFSELGEVEWWSRLSARKPKAWQAGLKEHVRSYFYYSYRVNNNK